MEKRKLINLDHHRFYGELLMILAAVLIWDGINSFVDKYFPQMFEWWGLVVGLIILIPAIELIRISERKNKLGDDSKGE